MNTATNEKSNFDLEEARKSVKSVTEEIARLFCERQALMKLIAESKNIEGQTHLPIFLPQREQELLTHFRNIAREKNVDDNMMDMLVAMLMSAGKFAQKDILKRVTILDTDRPCQSILRNNLLELASKVAKSYDRYDQEAEGTKIECLQEEKLLTRLTELHHGSTAVNLGCADGTHVTEIIRPHFKRVIGYDVSPDMISCAKEKFSDSEFHVHDLNEGIPLPDKSVDLVIANFGAASEVCTNLWQETARVLRTNGRAFFSFYNQNALVTKWWTPWSNSFRITINPNNDTILVPFMDENNKVYVYWIHGTATDDRGVYANSKANRFELKSIESSSPLWDDKPREFFKHSNAVQAAMEYENAHAHISPYLGQYLRVVIKKSI